MNAATDRATLDRRTLLKYGLGTVGAIAGTGFLGACSSSESTTTSTTTTPGPSTTVAEATESKLLEAARAEGALTTVAVGEPGSYYEPVIAAFQDYAGFDLDARNPTYPPTFAVRDVAEAADKGEPPPYDVIEVTQATAEQAAEAGLLDPYVSTSWTEIPAPFKADDGAWSGSYFGLVSFITNVSATGGYIPSSWDELASSPDTPKASFAMLGDPRTGQPLEGGLGLLTVMSAALANGGSLDDVEPGLALLRDLSDKGIFDLSDGTSLVALPDDAGTKNTPINALYSFDLPLAQANGKANLTKVQAAAPSDGLVAGFYPQAITKGATHPEAAKLWIEYLQSDDAAAIFLANGAIPTRHSAIRESGSDELKAALPTEDELNAPVPTPAQLAKAQATIDEKWTTYIPVGE